MSVYKCSSLAFADLMTTVAAISDMVAENNTCARTRYGTSLGVLLQCCGDAHLGHSVRWATLTELEHLTTIN